MPASKQRFRDHRLPPRPYCPCLRPLVKVPHQGTAKPPVQRRLARRHPWSVRSITSSTAGSSRAEAAVTATCSTPTGEVSGRVAFASRDEVGKAIEAAQAALPGWALTAPLQRARVMFRFKALLEGHMD